MFRKSLMLVGMVFWALCLCDCLLLADEPDVWACKQDSDCDSGQTCLWNYSHSKQSCAKVVLCSAYASCPYASTCKDGVCLSNQ
jgi:hypothetical protein